MSMTIRLYHPNGESYDIPANLSVTYDAAGNPLAVSYYEAGVIVCCDVAHPDWGKTLKRLGIKEQGWKPPSED